MLSDEAMHERMRGGWRGGLPETVCGPGSTLQSTARIRGWLPGVLERHDILTLNNAGAGDLVWFEKMQWDIDCRHFDLIKRHTSVIELDITRDVMPPADAILCRHTLNHIQPRVEMTLALFKKSARYLVATQFNESCEIDFTRLDLRRYLGEPLESCDDGGAPGCRLALWAIS